MYKTLTLTSLLLGTSCLIQAQNIPIDFETGGNGANWTWTVFENAGNTLLEIVPNPDVAGINTSATVAKFTALQAGANWAGCETAHGSGIGSFTINANNSQIKIMVWKSRISDVGIKLVRADNWSLGEIKVANTKVNEWEQLTFNFSAHIGNTYDQIVIFPDFGARPTDQIIYFDNVYGPTATTTGLTLAADEVLRISPNPALDRLNLEAATTVDQLNIYNMYGQLVLSQWNVAAPNQLDIAHLAPGVYALQAVVDGQMVQHKFVKQ